MQSRSKHLLGETTPKTLGDPPKSFNRWDRWEHLVENRSFRVDETKDGKTNTPRNEYQRDFDRLIFSSAFKRLQSKTQVFPLPGTAQVHNRLTHSLEVASVGRSLGSLVGIELAELLNKNRCRQDVIDFYRYELKDVILAACLAHDIGNPCFGHSGEKIISDYFIALKHSLDGKKIKSEFLELKKMSEPQWADLTHFEGNANTMRILTNYYHGKLPGGLRLTYLTLASMLKYPWEANAWSTLPQLGKSWGKKYGFFQEQKPLINDIAKKLNLLQYDKNNKKVTAFNRHPFVYLVEAADDICYLIMDMEDAHKINILSHEEVSKTFLELIGEIQTYFNSDLNGIEDKLKTIEDTHEQIVYLRSKCINGLTEISAHAFMNNLEKISLGKSSALIDLLVSEYGISKLKHIRELSSNQIYTHHTVSETMIGASKILPELLNLFIPGVLKNQKGEKRTYQQEKIFSLITSQYTDFSFDTFATKSPYTRILSLLDFLTGMTDDYIFELYRKLTGIERPHH